MPPSTPSPVFVSPASVIASSVELGPGVRIWDLSHVEPGAVIGAHTVIGRGVTVGSGARIGARCKVQNAALVYGPALLGDGVFIGPGAVLTNDHAPRAINPDGSVRGPDGWHRTGVVVEHGASVGAGAVCVAPVQIGRWAAVAAGAVVTHDVPDHGLVAGVPARRVGWVGRAGLRLAEVGEGRWVCPSTGETYRVRGDGGGLEVAS